MWIGGFSEVRRRVDTQIGNTIRQCERSYLLGYTGPCVQYINYESHAPTHNLHDGFVQVTIELVISDYYLRDNQHI